MAEKTRGLVRDLAMADRLLDKLDAGLRDRVQIRLGTATARLRSDVARVDEIANNPGTDPTTGWAEIHALRFQVDDFLEECLQLVAGASVRSKQLDNGYCIVADTLVDELVSQTPVGQWTSFTVLGSSEDYSRATRAIQVRFPAPTLWDLSFVAHELGHFVGPAIVVESGLGSDHPLELVFDSAGDGSESSFSHLQELFADAFASHVLGPAYGLSCVVNSFDPLLAVLPSPTHPAANDRVEITTAVLQQSGQAGPGWAATQILSTWSALVESADGAAGREPPEPSPFIAPVVALIQEHLPVSGYEGWDTANQLADALSDTGQPLPDDSYRIADVLNGAWIARLQSQSRAAVDGIAAAGMKLCRSIVEES